MLFPIVNIFENVSFLGSFICEHLFSLCLAQEHIKFKEMAKAKMLSKLKELQEQGRLASQLQSEFSALKVENENLSIQKSKAERETESWKALVKVMPFYLHQLQDP